MGNPKLINNTYSLLVVFLYKILCDPIISEDDKTKAGRLLGKLIPQKHLSESQLMEEFLQISESFLGKSAQFKKNLQEATIKIKEFDFNIEDILSAFLNQFVDLIEGLVDLQGNEGVLSFSNTNKQNTEFQSTSSSNTENNIYHRRHKKSLVPAQ